MACLHHKKPRGDLWEQTGWFGFPPAWWFFHGYETMDYTNYQRGMSGQLSRGKGARMVSNNAVQTSSICVYASLWNWISRSHVKSGVICGLPFPLRITFHQFVCVTNWIAYLCIYRHGTKRRPKKVNHQPTENTIQIQTYRPCFRLGLFQTHVCAYSFRKVTQSFVTTELFCLFWFLYSN